MYRKQPGGWSGSGGVNERLLRMKTQMWRGQTQWGVAGHRQTGQEEKEAIEGF